MRYDEAVVLRWRASTSDPWNEVQTWADVRDEGIATFDVGSGISRASAFLVTLRYWSVPQALRDHLRAAVQRATFGDFTLSAIRIRGKDRIISSYAEGDDRRRTVTITCTDSGAEGR